MTVMLKILDIIRDPKTQPRAELDTALVDEYTEARKAGAIFPPVVVALIDGKYICCDGFHRIAAAE